MKKILTTLITCFVVLSPLAKINAQEEIRERISTPKSMPRVINNKKQDKSIAVNRNADYINLSPEELLQKVFLKAGTCTTIDNVSVQVYNWDGSKWDAGNTGARGLAYFEKSDSDFPMESGLVLSTGDVREAEGKNDSDSALGKGIENGEKHKDEKGNTKPIDDDLQKIIAKQSNKRVTNYTVLEFDFQPTSRYMEFKYIFASEEYPEYVNSQYNDVFGFFINEVGKSEKNNLAILPTTDNIIAGIPIYEVTINNVNNGKLSSNVTKKAGTNPHNSQYYVQNIKNSLTTEFDGYTVVLTAKETVNPCKKYHLKIAVGNVDDELYGSGVFLESNSFQAGYSLSNRVGDEENSSIVYTSDEVNYIRANISDVAIQATTIQFEFKGTAVNGVDYTDINGNPLNDVYIVETGKNYIDIPYKITSKNAAGKTMDLKLFCPCAGSAKYAEMTVNIINPMSDVKLNSTSVCSNTEKGSITVNPIGNSVSYKYSIDNGTTWTTDNIFPNLSIGEYTIWTKEYANMEILKKNAKIVNINSPIATMINQEQCNNPNFSVNAGTLAFGDIGTWSIDSTTPISGVVIDNVNSPVTNVNVPSGNSIKLNWTVKSSKCTAISSITLKSNKSSGEGAKTYTTFNIQTCNSKETLNLNSLCNLNLSQSKDWECTTKDQSLQINAAGGTITFEKDKMHAGSEIFRYSTLDQCGNTIYNFLYIDFISQ